MTIAVVILACVAAALAVGLGVAVAAARRARRAADRATQRADALRSQAQPQPQLQPQPRPAAGPGASTDAVTLITPDQAADSPPSTPEPASASPEAGSTGGAGGAAVAGAEEAAVAGGPAELGAPSAGPAADNGAPSDDRSAMVTTAIWSLQGVELDLERQRDAAMPGAPEATSGVLAGALQREVERIREEMGTPGELHDELGRDPSAAAGLLLLRSVQLTLPAVAWRCNGFDLYVFDADGALQARLVCEGFEATAEEGAKSALAAVTEAVAPAGGRVELRKGDGGWAEATVSVPT